MDEKLLSTYVQAHLSRQKHRQEAGISTTVLRLISLVILSLCFVAFIGGCSSLGNSRGEQQTAHHENTRI